MDCLDPHAHCPVAFALDVIGDRWTMLILRDLTLNPARRFQDLAQSLRGCAPNTLSARLKALEANGLVERHLYETHPPRMEYRLSPAGRETAPVLKALQRLGRKMQADSGEPSAATG